MPASNVLQAVLSPEDPLFGLIYYVLGGWVCTLAFRFSPCLIPRSVNWLESCPFTRGDPHIPGAFPFIICATPEPGFTVCVAGLQLLFTVFRRLHRPKMCGHRPVSSHNPKVDSILASLIWSRNVDFLN
jgi:hypothetical protein